MARQEATNIFSDGLMMDLNPINTPKSVLTDCVNGAFLTYNGNEFILQNDMGNYKLEGCKLPPNFIPVGVKSYGSIIYIVSYNPLTEETEIGSYPSPRTRFDSSDGNTEETELKSYEYELEGISNYTELVGNKDIKLFILKSVNQEDDNLFLNPNDQYYLEYKNSSNVNEIPFQKLEYYIVDEKSILHKIDSIKETSVEEFTENPNNDNFNKVSWQVPGWIALQYKLFAPDKFTLNVREINVPEFFLDSTNQELLNDKTETISITVNTQITISDKDFIANLEDIANSYKTSKESYFKVQYRKYIKGKEGSENYVPLIDPQQVKSYNYDSNTLLLYNNYEATWTYNYNEETFTKTDTLCIEAIPYTEFNGNKLFYDQFKSTYEFDLSNIKSVNDFSIAENIFTYRVDNDSVLINFDAVGPFTNTGSRNYKYTIYSISEDWSLKELSEITGVGELLIGQNILNISFNENFYKENIYIIKLGILDKDNNEILFKEHFLVTTELLNEYYNESYDYDKQLTAEDWIGKYIDNIIIDNCDIDLTLEDQEQTQEIWEYYDEIQGKLQIDAYSSNPDLEEEITNSWSNALYKDNNDTVSNIIDSDNDLLKTANYKYSKPITNNWNINYNINRLKPLNGRGLWQIDEKCLFFNVQELEPISGFIDETNIVQQVLHDYNYIWQTEYNKTGQLIKFRDSNRTSLADIDNNEECVIFKYTSNSDTKVDWNWKSQNNITQENWDLQNIGIENRSSIIPIFKNNFSFAKVDINGFTRIADEVTVVITIKQGTWFGYQKNNFNELQPFYTRFTGDLSELATCGLVIPNGKLGNRTFYLLTINFEGKTNDDVNVSNLYAKLNKLLLCCDKVQGKGEIRYINLNDINSSLNIINNSNINFNTVDINININSLLFNSINLLIKEERNKINNILSTVTQRPITSSLFIGDLINCSKTIIKDIDINTNVFFNNIQNITDLINKVITIYKNTTSKELSFLSTDGFIINECVDGCYINEENILKINPVEINNVRLFFNGFKFTVNEIQKILPEEFSNCFIASGITKETGLSVSSNASYNNLNYGGILPFNLLDL